MKRFVLTVAIDDDGLKVVRAIMARRDLPEGEVEETKLVQMICNRAVSDRLVWWKEILDLT